MSLDRECFLCDDLRDRGGFVVFPSGYRLAADIAPLCVDHCLLYPSEHIPSLAHMSESNLRDFVRVVQQIQENKMFLGRDLLLFEHGVQPGRASVAGCCDHAHVHILPLRGELGGTVDTSPASIRALSTILGREEQEGVIEFSSKVQLKDIGLKRDLEYCWISFDLQNLSVFTVVGSERQYIRRIVGELVGVSKYKTWEGYDGELATQTTNKLRAAFT